MSWTAFLVDESMTAGHGRVVGHHRCIPETSSSPAPCVCLGTISSDLGSTSLARGLVGVDTLDAVGVLGGQCR